MNSTSQEAILSSIAGLRLKVEGLAADLTQLEALAQAAQPDAEADFDLMDPRNTLDPRNKRMDGTLTPRGEEICYRLFDAGLNRNQVKKALGISHNAATARWYKWRDLGGVNRIRRPLD